MNEFSALESIYSHSLWSDIESKKKKHVIIFETIFLI